MSTKQAPRFGDDENDDSSSERSADSLPQEASLEAAVELTSAEYGPEIVNSLRKLIRSFDVQSRRLRDNHQMTLPQLLCLRALIDHGPLTVNAIGSRIHLGASTLVGILDRLETKGLIQRNRNPKDRREVIVAASDAGKSLVDSIHSPIRDGLSQSLNKLPVEEQMTIATSLQRLFDLMQSELQNSSAKEAGRSD